MIPKTKIENILNEADIVKIISDRIPLQKKGRNYFAVCPFHNDTNPSMVVSREKRIYKCFSCGANGNAIKFIENYLHLSFLEALKTVSETTSIDLSSDFANMKHSVEKYSVEQKKLFEINEAALMFFKVSLASKFGQSALTYLNQRKLTSSEIETWELGWSSTQASLSDYLIKQGYTVDQLKTASLITIKDNKIFDYFRNRLIFPIRDLDNNLIGFSGRSLDNSKEVKYLNVRETLVFQKSHLLFNIHHALMTINKTKTIIITEGFMDVFSLSRIGFAQTVATMGTNFSEFHVSTLKKLKAVVILFFDGDEAGVRANLKAVSKLITGGITVKVIDNLTSLDPDELINNNQASKVKQLITNALNPWDYAIHKLQTLYQLDNYDQLKKFLEEIFSLLRLIDEPIMINQVLHQLEKLTNLNFEVLNQSYLQSKTNSPFRKINVHSTQEIAPVKNLVLKPDIFPYRDILGVLAKNPQHIEVIEANWELIYQTIDSQDINLVIVLKSLIAGYRAQTYHSDNWAEFSEIVNQAMFNNQALEWNLTESWFNQLATKTSLTPAFLALEERYWKQKQNYIRTKINQTHDQETLHNYLLQQNESHKKLLDLRRKRNEWQWKK